jgi:hypothetical protein
MPSCRILDSRQAWGHFEAITAARVVAVVALGSKIGGVAFPIGNPIVVVFAGLGRTC